MNEELSGEYGPDNYWPVTWGIEGYNLPKTSLGGSRRTGQSIGKRINFTESFIKLRPGTEPCKYSDTLEKTEQKYWFSKNFLFNKAKRETQTLSAMKRSKSTPGPGEYIDVEEKKKKTKFKLGLFSKGDRGSFMDGIVAASQQVPSAHKYRPYTHSKKKFQNTIYHKPYFPQPPKKKDGIGPGSYSEVELALDKHVLKKNKSFVHFKSKRDCFAQVKAKQKSFVPGAGTYTVALNTICFNAEKSKVPIAHQKIIKKNSNILRTTEKSMKDREWIPGPGTYYTVPYKRKGEK